MELVHQAAHGSVIQFRIALPGEMGADEIINFLEIRRRIGHFRRGVGEQHQRGKTGVQIVRLNAS